MISKYVPKVSIPPRFVTETATHTDPSSPEGGILIQDMGTLVNLDSPPVHSSFAAALASQDFVPTQQVPIHNPSQDTNVADSTVAITAPDSQLAASPVLIPATTSILQAAPPSASTTPGPTKASFAAVLSRSTAEFSDLFDLDHSLPQLRTAVPSSKQHLSNSAFDDSILNTIVHDKQQDVAAHPSQNIHDVSLSLEGESSHSILNAHAAEFVPKRADFTLGPHANARLRSAPSLDNFMLYTADSFCTESKLLKSLTLANFVVDSSSNFEYNLDDIKARLRRDKQCLDRIYEPFFPTTKIKTKRPTGRPRKHHYVGPPRRSKRLR